MKRLTQLIHLLSLIISDMAALLCSFLIAFLLRSHVPPLFFTNVKKPLALDVQLKYGFVYGAVIIIFIFAIEKLYTRRFFFWEETRHLLKGITLSFTVLMMIVFVSRRYTQFSRAVIILAGILSIFMFPIFRLMIKGGLL